MMEPMSNGVMPRAAAFLSSFVRTRRTRAQSGRMPRPCCARMARSRSASSPSMYASDRSSAQQNQNAEISTHFKTSAFILRHEVMRNERQSQSTAQRIQLRLEIMSAAHHSS